VAAVPAQIALLLVAMLTVGVELVFTVIVKAFEVATVELAHATFEVKTQVTTSLLFKVVLVKTALFVPAFVPFTFH
jgi:hypothetical protein